MSTMLTIRKAFGMSQNEFATTIGVSQSAVSLWERTGKNPNPETIARIRYVAKQRRLPWRRDWPNGK